MIKNKLHILSDIFTAFLIGLTRIISHILAGMTIIGVGVFIIIGPSFLKLFGIIDDSSIYGYIHYGVLFIIICIITGQD